MKRIEFSPGTIEQVQKIASWWEANRAASRDLFHDELTATLQMLKVTPKAASAYPHPRIPGLRRALLQRTRYHVYFTFHEDQGLVFVHAVWHATRGHGPRL